MSDYDPTKCHPMITVDASKLTLDMTYPQWIDEMVQHGRGATVVHIPKARNRTDALIEALATVSKHGVSVYSPDTDMVLPKAMEPPALEELSRATGLPQHVVLTVHAALLAKFGG